MYVKGLAIDPRAERSFCVLCELSGVAVERLLRGGARGSIEISFLNFQRAKYEALVVDATQELIIASSRANAKQNGFRQRGSGGLRSSRRTEVKQTEVTQGAPNCVRATELRSPLHASSSCCCCSLHGG